MRVLATLAVVLLASGARADAMRDLSEPRRERVTCSIAAALKFSVPVNVMLAVAEMEGGRPGQWVRNRNGSYDVGPLQFNTRYLEHMERRYGITAADVATAGCYSYELAAWRLRRHLERDDGDSWTRVANYHSRKPVHNVKYRRRLMRKAATWSRWLSGRFPTYEVDGSMTQRGSARTRGASTRRQARIVAPSPTVVVASAITKANAYGEDDREVAAALELLDESDSGGPSRWQSIGTPHAGSLAGAVQLGGHPGYRIRERSRAWATSSTIDRLVQAFDQLLAIDPAAPRVRVHDLSLRAGGPMDGHKSHQSGRDVDITYYQHGCRGDCRGRPVAPYEFDAVRQWRVLRYWLERDHAEFVFIDYALQQPLYEAAKASGATARQLARWFQYPRGPLFPSGLIRHVPGHANHVHVRFRCTPGDRACQRTATRPLASGGDLMSPPLDLVHDEDERELLELLAD